MNNEIIDCLFERLAKLVVYAGPHWLGEGWQAVFEMGRVRGASIPVRVSIVWLPGEDVSLMAWGLMYHPIRNVTPERAVRVLGKILERSEA